MAFFFLMGRIHRCCIKMDYFYHVTSMGIHSQGDSTSGTRRINEAIRFNRVCNHNSFGKYMYVYATDALAETCVWGGGGMASHQIRAEATDLRAWGKKAGRDHQGFGHSPGRGRSEARVHLQLHLNRLGYTYHTSPISNRKRIGSSTLTCLWALGYLR